MILKTDSGIFFLCSVLAIEDDYKGPALEDGKVTLKFMLELMEHYKQQKKLHRKYAYKVTIAELLFKQGKKKKVN